MTILREERISGQRLILGDALKVLPLLGGVDAVVTDPVWPNHGGMFGDLDAKQLLQDAMASVTCRRAVIHLRNDQDPRFLEAIPASLPFLQSMTLRYAAVGYIGRFMTGNDVAFAFGEWPSVHESSRIIPAIGPVATKPTEKNGHPCPRNILHVKWLVHWWGSGVVLDPFMGSGTTLVACQNLGRQGIGIEIDPEYFEIACRRVDEASRQPDLLIDPPKPESVRERFDL